RVQAGSGVDEECGAAAHLVAQERDAGARLVERLDDDVLELIAQELFHGAFVFFLHFGKVGEQPNGPESARSRVARVEKFLDGVGCVRAVAENLLDRGVARPLRGKRLARLFELLGRLLLRATGLDEARLRIANGRIEFSRAELGSLENEISGIDALRERREFTFNAADRGGPVLLGGGVTRGRFLGLLRFGLFAGRFLYEASR